MAFSSEKFEELDSIEMEIILENTPENNRKLSVMHCNKGDALYKKKDYKASIFEYNAAIKKDPDYAPAYSKRGLVYSELGNTDQAILDFTEAINKDPTHLLNYYCRGVAFYNRANIREVIDFADELIAADRGAAINDLNEVIKFNPNFEDAYSLLGLLYHADGFILEAAINYSKAIKLNENLTELRDHLKSISRTAIFSAIENLDHNKQIEVIKYCLLDTPLKQHMLRSSNIFNLFENKNSKENAYIKKLVLRLKKIDPDFYTYEDSLKGNYTSAIEMKTFVKYRK